jgi:hypothetical protein
MSDIKDRGLALAEYLGRMPRAQRERINELNRQDAAEAHAKFKEAFANETCSLCGERLTSFNSNRPCRHWLLKPPDFRKEHFELLAADHSWSGLEGYLRWLANEEAFARH